MVNTRYSLLRGQCVILVILMNYLLIYKFEDSVKKESFMNGSFFINN